MSELQSRTKKKKVLFTLIFLSLSLALIFFYFRYFKEEEFRLVKVYVKCGLSNDIKVSQPCYAREFEFITKEKGPQVALSILLKTQKYDKKLASCHDIAHIIGKNALRNGRPAINVTQILKTSVSDCEFGMTHGLIEDYLKSYSFDSSRQSIREICGDDEVVDCNHIVGHFLLVWTNKNIDKAASMCEELDQKRQRYICETGVFMEYITGQNLLTHGLITDDWFKNEASLEKLTQICNKQKGVLSISCWEELPHAILPRFNYNLEDAYSYCDLAGDADATIRCKNLTEVLITGKNMGRELMFLTKN